MVGAVVDNVGTGGGAGNARKIKRLDERVAVLENVGEPDGTSTLNSFADLEALHPAVLGLHTLNPDWVYYLNGPINMGSNTMEGHNVTIIGNTALQTLIFTASVNPLFASDGDGYFNMSWVVAGNSLGPFFDLTLGSDTLSILQMHQVFFTGMAGAGSVGIVRSSDRVTIGGCFFQDLDGGLGFTGTHGEINIANTSIKAKSGATSFKGITTQVGANLDIFFMGDVRFSTANATDRCVLFDSGATYASPLRVASCTIRGSGTFVDAAGLQKTDPNFIATDNEGTTAPSDSLFTGSASFVGNTTETVIATQSAQVRIGNASAGHDLFNGGAFTERFTLSGAETQLQEFTYDGTRGRTFNIAMDSQLTRSGGGTVLVGLGIQVNNVTVADSVTETEVANAATPGFSRTIVDLEPGDDVQLVISNNSSTANLTVNSARWTITRVV